MARMTKMQAIAILYKLRNEAEYSLKCHQERIDDATKQRPIGAPPTDLNDHIKYQKQVVEECRLTIAALDMAGKAMTR